MNQNVPDQLSDVEIQDLLKTINISDGQTNTLEYTQCENCKRPTKRVFFESKSSCKIKVIDSMNKIIYKALVAENEVICVECGTKYIFTTQFNDKNKKKTL